METRKKSTGSWEYQDLIIRIKCLLKPRKSILDKQLEHWNSPLKWAWKSEIFTNPYHDSRNRIEQPSFFAESKPTFNDQIKHKSRNIW